jgi:hypothetical protein
MLDAPSARRAWRGVPRATYCESTHIAVAWHVGNSPLGHCALLVDTACGKTLGGLSEVFILGTPPNCEDCTRAWVTEGEGD